MFCQRVAFTRADCLVEIDQVMPASTTYTAFLWVVEDDGALVRPLVSESGRRIRFHAPTEPLAFECAIRYLGTRFGERLETGHPCSLGASTVGQPYFETLQTTPANSILSV